MAAIGSKLSADSLFEQGKAPEIVETSAGINTLTGIAGPAERK